MSPVSSCATLLLVLFAISQHSACSARPRAFGGTAEIEQDEDSSQKSNLPKKKNDGHTMNITDVQGVSRLQITLLEVREMEMENPKARSTNHSSRKRIIHHQSKSLSETRSRGTKATYKVPQRKRGGKEPGFNLDYSPPKVHPPHHN